MNKIILFSITLFLTGVGYSQSVGIGTTSPNPKSVLDLTSTNQGLLAPRVTDAQMTAIGAGGGDEGMLVYNITQDGFYYFSSGGSWLPVSGADSDWLNNGANLYNGNTGDVGIGTASPSEKLHVAGNVNVGANVAGGTTVVYDIPVGSLMNMGSNCAPNGQYGTANSGFTWNSINGGAVASLSIEINVGVDCETTGTTLNTTLNGSAAGTIQTGIYYCNCTARDNIRNISPSFVIIILVDLIHLLLIILLVMA